MKCGNCDKECDNLMKVLMYFANGRPVFREYCSECEKQYWMKIKEMIFSD